MALVTRTVILGIKTLEFAREGLADALLGNVASDHKPALAADVYESLGRVEKASVKRTVEELEVRNASSGTYGEEFSIPMSQKMELMFTLQNINQIVIEDLYLASGAITVGTPLQPMAQTAKIRGWLHVVRADQTGTETLLEFLWVELSVESMDTAEKNYTCELKVKVLKNALNTVEIDALAAL